MGFAFVPTLGADAVPFASTDGYCEYLADGLEVTPELSSRNNPPGEAGIGVPVVVNAGRRTLRNLSFPRDKLKPFVDLLDRYEWEVRQGARNR